MDLSKFSLIGVVGNYIGTNEYLDQTEDWLKEIFCASAHDNCNLDCDHCPWNGGVQDD
jgi:hypothetical protein